MKLLKQLGPPADSIHWTRGAGKRLSLVSRQGLYRPRAQVSMRLSRRLASTRRIVPAVLAALVLVLVACGSPDRAPTLTVYAAASLTDVLSELTSRFDGGRANVVFNFAGSNTLRDQILHGAEADVFFSAHPRHMDAVESAGLLSAHSTVDVLTNRLVMVARPGLDEAGFPPTQGTDTALKRIAVAQPGAVPAGIYAMEALSSLGLTDSLRPLLVPALDVRAALAYAESGNVDAAIVYATDAAVSGRVRIVYDFPESSHSPIRYPAAVLRSARNHELALQFLDFLRSDRADATYAKYGFLRVSAASVGAE